MIDIMIDEQINTYATRIVGNTFFHNDTVAMHTVKTVKQYFANKKIRILEWSSYKKLLGEFTEGQIQNGR